MPSPVARYYSYIFDCRLRENTKPSGCGVQTVVLDEAKRGCLDIVQFVSFGINHSQRGLY